MQHRGSSTERTRSIGRRVIGGRDEEDEKDDDKDKSKNELLAQPHSTGTTVASDDYRIAVPKSSRALETTCSTVSPNSS